MNAKEGKYTAEKIADASHRSVSRVWRDIRNGKFDQGDVRSVSLYVSIGVLQKEMKL